MHESTHRRASAALRQLQTEQLWRQENQQLQEESILTDTKTVIGRLRQNNAVVQRANLDVLRQHIEAFIAPPPLSAHGDPALSVSSKNAPQLRGMGY